MQELIDELYPKKIHPDLLTSLGAVVHKAATIDTALISIMLRLVGHNDSARVMPLICGMSTKMRITQIRITVGMQYKGDTKRLEKLCDELRGSFKKRNDLVHGILAPVAGERQLRVQPTKFNGRGEMPKAETYTPEGILAIAKALTEQFDAINKEIMTLIPETDPDKQ